MSKYILLSILTLNTIMVFGQEMEKNDPLFNNWFASKPQPIIKQFNDNPPPPGVPLDGGLIALIAAGGAMGYKKFKDTKVGQ